MFDPDRPQKNRENRSLLSFGATPDKPVLHEPTAPEPPRQPLAAHDREPEPRTLAQAEQSPAQEKRGVLRSLFGRAKGRMTVVSRLEEEAPERSEPDTPHGDDSRDASAPEEQRYVARDNGRYRPHEEPEPPRAARAEENIYWRPIVDPARVVSGVLRAKRLIAAATVLGAIAGVLIALATPKQYYSATDILFDPRDLQILDRDLTRGSLPSDATLALIENQVAIIRSSVVLNRVVERLRLTEDPEFNGEGGSLLGMLNPRALLSFGGGSANPGTRLTLTVQNLARKMRVERNERTFIIHIGAITQDPEKSALIANTTAEVYLDQTGEMQQSTANRATTELTERLGELQAAVETAERAVADFKAQHDLIDADGRLISDDEMVRLNDQLATVRARTAEIQARVDSARGLDVSQVLGGSLPEQVSSPMMTELLGQYASLKQQADRAASRLGPRHPDNMSVQAELAGAREAIAGELRRVVASMQVELTRARQLEQELSGRLAQLKVQKGDVEAQRVQLRELEREAAARRAVYESFLLRARETGQQRSINTANVSVISTAYPPLLPNGPSRVSIVMAGVVLGFLAGIGLGGGMGALESLRENMGEGGHSTPSRARGAATRRREVEAPGPGEDGDFDPPPARGSGSDDGRPGRSERRSDRGVQAMRPGNGARGSMSVAEESAPVPAGRYGEPGQAARTAHPHAPAAAIAPGFYPAMSAEALAEERPSGFRSSTHAYAPFGATDRASASAPWRREMSGSATAMPRAAGETSLAPDLPPVDRLRHSLRAFRREIDELAERRRHG
jgi:polysaccharide biosynthesis transport protein